jgi:hypothetical protein
MDPDEATKELLSYQGTGFGRITDVGTCRISQARAIELLGLRFPPAKAHRALALFPRFREQMSALDNTLNRTGILAVKGEEKRAVRHLNTGPGAVDWRSFIDRARVSELAGILPHGHA